MKRLATTLTLVGILILAASGTIQAQEPDPSPPGAWIIYPGGTEHWVGNDRHSDVWGSDLHTSIHEALGYSGQYLCPGPSNSDICYWEFYNPPPEGSIIELRGAGLWDIGGDGAQGGQGREKMKSLVVQQNGISIRGQDYDDGTGTMVQQEILFNNGATTALLYLEASDLTIENLHIKGTWPSNGGGYALAIGRYTLIGPDPHATGLIVTGNTFTNLRAMFDQRPMVTDLTVADNLVEDTYYNIFKKGVTFAGDNTLTGNTFNHVGEGKTYPALQVLGHSGTTCIDNNTFNGWRPGQYAVAVTSPLATPIGIGTNNLFVDQVGGSGAGYQLYPLASGGHSVGAPSEADITGCAPSVIEVTIDIKPGSDPNSINPNSKGVVPVAVLTTGDFDATTVDPDTVVFAGASPLRWAMEDVDRDGDIDLLFHFKTQELGLDESSTEATLTGATHGGTSIQGTDTVNIVPKGK